MPGAATRSVVYFIAPAIRSPSGNAAGGRAMQKDAVEIIELLVIESDLRRGPPVIGRSRHSACSSPPSKAG